MLGRPFESWLRDHTELSMGSIGSYVANCKRLEQAGTNDILPPRTCVATDCTTTSGASAGGRRTKRRTLGVGMEMTCICVSVV